jgi:glycosyltransferase involved in cell wall biosynthesis
MRICLINNLYPPHARSGAERVVHEEAKALKALGHDVCVITAVPLAADGDASVKTAEDEGVRVYRFYPLNLFFFGELVRHGSLVRSIWHLWDLVNPFTARTVREILERERPDIVHTHNLKGLGFGTVSAIRRLGIRHVHTFHDVQLAVPSGLIIKGAEHGPLIDGTPAKLYAWLVKRIIGSPDVVISPSRFLLRFYEQHGFCHRSQKIFLTNPAPVPVTVPRIAADETRFLFLGQIEAHKGIIELIEAFKELLAEGVRARLEFVGEGSLREWAAAAAGKERNIVFYGRRNPEQFPALFAEADWTILNTLCYENAPYIVPESFSFGVPILVADIGGAAELVQNGHNGFKFTAGDQEALLTALRAAVGSGPRWSEFSSACLKFVELHDAEHHAQRLVEIYKNKDSGLAHEGPVVPIRYRPRP